MFFCVQVFLNSHLFIFCLTRIFNIIQSSKNATSEDELQMQMSNVDKSQRLMALTSLLAEKKIRVFADPRKNKPHYEVIVEDKSLDDVVLEVIKEAGHNGIWTKDIRLKAEITSYVIVNKVLKNLENKKLIKSVKSISNRKLYVLYDLIPDETVTGGACYEAGLIREDVVKNLKAICMQFIFKRFEDSYKHMMSVIHSSDDAVSNNDKVYCSAKEVFEKVQKDIASLSGDIKENDIEHILNILLYEGKLMRQEFGRSLKFRYNPYNRDKTDLFYAPCMVCHLYKDCKPGSAHVSPENCHYLSVEKF